MFYSLIFRIINYGGLSLISVGNDANFIGRLESSRYIHLFGTIVGSCLVRDRESNQYDDQGERDQQDDDELLAHGAVSGVIGEAKRSQRESVSSAGGPR